MKRTILAALALAFGLGALAAPAAAQAVKGPIVDKVLFNARSQEDLGLMDLAAGKSDLWTYGTAGNVWKLLPADVKAKLEPYTVSGASYVGLILNPFPDRAPYLSDPALDATGKAQFNPLGIRKVRFALNWLINRQKVVADVFDGAGVPMFTPVVPGLPNASRFNLLASRLGMTEQGDEKKALADIDAAMTEASALPELQGRLVKASPYWTFDGSPVTLRFVIRADDPNARVPIGRYVADRLEKAGFKVERLEYDRSKAGGLVNRSDPASLQWSLYTEGLGSNETKAYWEMTIAYDYAPWLSIMPGGNNKTFWNYSNAELDRLTQAVVSGNISGSKEYWDDILAATDLGMRESVRIMVAGKTSYLAAAKDRFKARVAYGIGNGLDKWSAYTADVNPEASGPDKGKKVLRMTGFSSRGALFMNAWDPVGPQGFGDTYSGMIVKQLSDLELEANPSTGVPMAVRATWTGLASSSNASPVPASALLWNPASRKWESGLSWGKDASGAFAPLAGAPITARSTATFAFRYGAWHHGRPVDQNDYRYALAFPYELSYKGGAEPRAFDAAYASGVNPRLARAKGYTFNKDGSISVWSDAYAPVDPALLASQMVPSLQVAAVAYSGAVLPWEILEGLRSLVVDGGASGTAWSFNTDANSTEVDLLNPKLVTDLKARLNDFILAKKVPASLAGFVPAEEALKDYRLALAWLEARGHAYISNGGFTLQTYDAKANSGVLAAFRDKAYPFEAGYWVKALKADYAKVGAVTVAEPRKGQDLKVSVAVSLVSYPEVVGAPTDKAAVTVSLMAGDKATIVKAKTTKAGTYEALIPAALVDALPLGAYTLVAEASLGAGDSPGFGSTVLLKF